MQAATPKEHVFLTFKWEGPSQLHGGHAHGGSTVDTINLIFQDARTAIFVNILQGLPPFLTPLRFTCRKPVQQQAAAAVRETHPKKLAVTIDQIRKLSISAGIITINSSTKSTSFDITQSNLAIQLNIPADLEIGEKYSLVVRSDGENLSAKLEKREEEGEGSSKKEFRLKVQNMGKALIREGERNLEQALNGTHPLLDSSTTRADVFAHGMQGVLRAGKQMHPGLKATISKSETSPEDLELLSTEELQELFEETFVKDKRYEIQRHEFACAGDIEGVNRIHDVEMKNSQLLITIAGKLEERGIDPQIPSSDKFRSLALQSGQGMQSQLQTIMEALQDSEKGEKTPSKQ
jgi:hypothetical protein